MAALTDIAITLYQGESFEPIVFVLEDSNGDPIDLTDCTCHMTVREAADDATAKANLTDGNLGMSVDRLAGRMTPVGITAADTATWEATSARHPLVFDLFVVFSDGTRHLTHAGTIAVVAAATRYP